MFQNSLTRLYFTNITQDDFIEDLFFINVGTLKSLDYLGFQKAQRKAGKTLGTYEQFKKHVQNTHPSCSERKNVI